MFQIARVLAGGGGEEARQQSLLDCLCCFLARAVPGGGPEGVETVTESEFEGERLSLGGTAIEGPGDGGIGDQAQAFPPTRRHWGVLVWFCFRLMSPAPVGESDSGRDRFPVSTYAAALHRKRFVQSVCLRQLCFVSCSVCSHVCRPKRYWPLVRPRRETPREGCHRALDTGRAGSSFQLEFMSLRWRALLLFG
jgi:hypothetical protein